MPNPYRKFFVWLISYMNDDAGTETDFVLKFRYKNEAGRKINGVSILFFDCYGQLIGNSDLNLDISPGEIDVGDAEQY